MNAEGLGNAQDRLATLIDLPVELLYKIHLLSCSSTLPCVSRGLHAIFASTSTEYRVKFLWSLCVSRLHNNKVDASGMMGKAVQFPLCALPVYKILRDDLFDHMELDQLRKFSSMNAVHHDFLRREDPTLPEYVPTVYTIADVKALPQGRERGQISLDGPRFMSCALLYSLPKRLFSHLSSASDEPDLPLIAAMLDDMADLHAHQGYALNRAVAVQHIPLLKFLLSKWPDTFLHTLKAMQTAIRLDNIQIVKLLLYGLAEDGNPPMATPTGALNVSNWRILIDQAKKQGSEEMVQILELGEGLFVSLPREIISDSYAQSLEAAARKVPRWAVRTSEIKGRNVTSM